MKYSQKELLIIEKGNVNPVSRIVDCFKGEFSPSKLGIGSGLNVLASFSSTAAFAMTINNKDFVIGILEDSIIISQSDKAEKSLRYKWEDCEKAGVEIILGKKNFGLTKKVKFSFIIDDKKFSSKDIMISKGDANFMIGDWIGQEAWNLLSSKFS